MKHLTFLLSLLLAFAVSGQTYDLAVTHGVNAMNGNQLLSQAHGTAATSRSKMPDLWGWAKAKGWTDAEVLSLRYAESAWHDIFWRGENGNYNSAAPGHAINITVPNGKFPVTFPLPFASGVYTGQGSRFHDSNGTHSYGSTEFYIDHSNWKTARGADRVIMRSANWGTDGGYGAWVHHYRIEGFHFNGARRTKWMPTGTAESAGIAAWDSGEASSISNCYFSDWEKDGILFARGTPARVDNCSMFTVSRFGVAIVGGGSVTLTNVSGDESGIALIGSIAGYGRPGNTKLAVLGGKQETSTSAEFKPWKGSSFLYAEGWINASINGVSFASVWTTPYDFITWKRDPSIGNWSSIEVTGTHFFGNAPRCLLYEEASNKEYLFVGNAWQNAMQSWTWHEQHGLRTRWATINPGQRTGSSGRLQHVGSDGATDWATAKVYDPTGGGGTTTNPPATTCTYTTGAWGAWSTCVSGQQTRTRTVTATPSGCTGTPPASSETQSCTPTPGAIIAQYTFSAGTATAITGTGGTMTRTHGATTMSGGILTNSNASTSYRVGWKGTTTYVFEGFTPSTASGSLGYRLLAGIIDTDGQGRGIMLLPDGSVIDNRKAQGDRVLLPAGTVKTGTKATLTVTLSAPMDATFLGAWPGQGNSWIGTLEGLIVR